MTVGMFNRLHGASLLLALTIVAGSVLSAQDQWYPKKPNVLFIVVDDLRPELGCYGREHIHSPNIDALAKRGVVFDRAYVQQATCSPSRTSVLTGMRPDKARVWDLKTHFRDEVPDVVTLPQLFKENGYFVQGMGKVYHPKLDDPVSWSVPWQNAKAKKYYAIPKTDPDRVAELSRFDDQIGSKKNGPVYECADVPDDTYQDGATAELAVKTIRELANRDQPFFLAVGFSRPHLPFVAPEKYWDLYDQKAIELAPNPYLAKNSPEYAVNTDDGEMRGYQGVPWKGQAIPDELARKLKHAYYACVSYVDACLGRVLAELDAQGVRDDTIVILWGDHGWKLGEHGCWGKHSNVENDTNAPLILSVPGLENEGTHEASIVEFVDIYPTLAELAELPLPDHLDGHSLLPVLENPASGHKEFAVSQWPSWSAKGYALMGYSLRTDRYRLTVWVHRKDSSRVEDIELYDLLTDPGENVNVSGKSGYEAVVNELMTKFREQVPGKSAREAWRKLNGPKEVRPAFDYVENDPSLPDILLYGDSISIDYTQRVRDQLEDKANVYRLWGNGLDSGSFIPKMVRMHTVMRDRDLDRPWLFKWDVIHFNVGLHDLKYVTAEGEYNTEKGTRVSSVETYKENLREIIAYLQQLAPSAKLIFATTTPVPEASPGRIPGDARIYNQAARDVLREHPGIAVNDLYALCEPHQKEWCRKPGDVHYSESGIIAQANKVAEAVQKALQSPTRYNALEEKVEQLIQFSSRWDLTGPVPEKANTLRMSEMIRSGMVGPMLNVKGGLQTREAQRLAVENSRLGIPLLFGYDVIHGYQTIFPIPLGMPTWQLGSQSGHAIADFVFGDYNPSGRLPMSFPRGEGQLPIHYNHLSTGKSPEAGEKPGFHTTHYSDASVAPLFPFGHGLSYTKFCYSNLQVEITGAWPDFSVNIGAEVTNTGDRDDGHPDAPITDVVIRKVKINKANTPLVIHEHDQVELRDVIINGKVPGK